MNPVSDVRDDPSVPTADSGRERYLALESEASILPHAAQLARGFRLRFEPALETEFRDAYWARNTARVYYGVLIGALIFAAFAFKDILAFPREVWIWTAGIRLFGLIPMMMMLYVLTRQRGRAIAELGVTAGGFAALFGLAVTIYASIRLQHPLPYEGLLIVTFYLYFMVGLRLPLAALGALPLLPAFVAGSLSLGLPVAETIIRAFYLLTANVIGIFGVYTLERLARQAYLTEQLARFRAERDPLTLIHNRRALLEHLRRLWRLGRRQRESIAVFLIDVDHFKQYNDRHGHLAGDACLLRVAQALSGCLQRPLDMVGRFGGEEFLAIAYSPDAASVERLAEKLRVAVQQSGDNAMQPAPAVTVSIGGACLVPETHLDEFKLLEYADNALYPRQGRRPQPYRDRAPAPFGQPGCGAARYGALRRPRLNRAGGAEPVCAGTAGARMRRWQRRPPG